MSCEYVATMGGKQTLIVYSGGTSRSQSGNSGAKGDGASHSSSTNNNWAEIGRELFTVAEVAQAHPRMCFVFTPGVPPVLTYLRRYYEPPLDQSPGGNAIKDFITALVFFIASAIFAVAITKLAMQ